MHFLANPANEKAFYESSHHFPTAVALLSVYQKEGWIVLYTGAVIRAMLGSFNNCRANLLDGNAIPLFVTVANAYSNNPEVVQTFSDIFARFIEDGKNITMFTH